MLNKSKSGGFRPGSGRPKGSGKYREATEPLRVPRSLLPQVKDLLAHYLGQPLEQPLPSSGPTLQAVQSSPYTRTVFPLYASRVAAGSPVPVDDDIEANLDLNEHLVKHPAATFLVRVEGESMLGAGIYPNDILVVDRSLKPSHGKVVIAMLNGELTVKRLSMQRGVIKLLPENDRYPEILITEEMNFTILGSVTSVIHAL